jgi:Transposase IS66 family
MSGRDATSYILTVERQRPVFRWTSKICGYTLRIAFAWKRLTTRREHSPDRACDYTLTLWSRLSRFLEYPELELSNNLAENAMRPVALGRRNWIHVGSQEAGPRVAAIISIVETCRRLSLPLRDYLGSVLPGLADFPIFLAIECPNSRPTLGPPESNPRNWPAPTFPGASSSTIFPR